MELVNLVDIPEENRDEKWENDFFQKLTQGQISIIKDEPQAGPDGWPYLLASTDVTASENVQQVLSWLKDKGIGLVINPQKSYPDYVFTYGMIWNFLETGLFFRPTQTQNSGQAMIKMTDIAASGNPPETYLPTYARKVLRDFLQQQGVLLPRILAINLKQGTTELVFSLESLGNPPESEHQGIAEAVSWFLPPHYSLLIMSEKGLPEFHAL